MGRSVENTAMMTFMEKLRIFFNIILLIFYLVYFISKLDSKSEPFKIRGYEFDPKQLVILLIIHAIIIIIINSILLASEKKESSGKKYTVKVNGFTRVYSIIDIIVCTILLYTFINFLRTATYSYNQMFTFCVGLCYAVFTALIIYLDIKLVV